LIDGLEHIAHIEPADDADDERSSQVAGNSTAVV
jgi:hypothetical protein